MSKCAPLNARYEKAIVICALLLLSLVTAANAKASDFAFITTTDYSTGSSSVIWMNEQYDVDKDVASIYSDAVSCYYNGLIYVINRYGADNIQVLDPENGFVTLRQFSVGNGSDPHDISFFDDTKAYVTRYNTNELWVVNPQSGSHTGTIDLSPFADGDGICEMDKMLARAGNVFVSIQKLDRNNWWLPTGPGVIVIIDMSADTLIDLDPSKDGIQGIELPYGNPYSDIEFDPYSGKLFISCVGTWGVNDGGVVTIDPDSLTVTGTMITEAQAGGDIVDVEIVSPEKGYIVISDANFYNVLKSFNPQTGEVLSTLYAPQAYTLSDIEVSPDKKLFLCDRSATNPGIRIYNCYNDTEETTSPIDVGLPPFQITFSYPKQTGDETPYTASLEQNYPNPFNPSTTIPFTLARSAHVAIDIYDLSGKHVKTLLRELLPAGHYSTNWNGLDQKGRPVSSGVYFATMRTEGRQFTRKLILIR